MSRDKDYLTDIMESAKQALKYAYDCELDEFLLNDLIQDAVIRRFEVIGEASSRVSQAVKDKYNDIPWNEMKSMRNILIHQYDDVDLDNVWETVQRDLSDLVKRLETILEDL